MYLPSLEYLIDGDEETAFNPDEVGLPRELELYLDLGGTFRLGRVRLFPRLDSQHRELFPQSFFLGLQAGNEEEYAQVFNSAFDSSTAPAEGTLNALGGLSYFLLFRFSAFALNGRSIVEWPGTQQVTGIRQARYVRFQNLLGLPWELAELELYSDGTIPEGEFVSRPLPGGGDPVWGRVRYEGGDLSRLPVSLQTRTGPDGEPFHYFILAGEREVRVNRASWEVAEDVEGAVVKGPVRPNPSWSLWQSVEEGAVRSPGPNRYLQFRLRVLDLGTKIEQLHFEYAPRPLVQALQAEIDPQVVEAGQETAFTLSAAITMSGAETGLRYLQVLTPAEVVAVDSVRVDGQQVVYTLSHELGQGITLNLWKRLLRDNSFIQVFLRARVFADGTPFAVRGRDRRLIGAEVDTAYQFAQEGDIDPRSLGTGLVVRLRSTTNPLLAGLQSREAFTPNGDGINDIFTVEYHLLKLTRLASVYFQIFDLSGRLVFQDQAHEGSGHFLCLWDGLDVDGRLVTPGLYLYQVQVGADQQTISRQGVVRHRQ